MNRNHPVTLTLSLCLMLAAFAVPATAADLANLQAGPSALHWQPTAGAAGWVLTVSGPDGFYLREQFDSAPALGLFDTEGQLLADGLYTYELQALPQISAQLRQDLDAAANDLEWREYLAARMDSSELVQSGHFRIHQGALVQGDQEELSAPDLGGAVPAGDFAVGQAVPEGGLDHTQVINMDLLVDGSLCVGFDCGSSQNFGFDTVRLRENNLRIHFDDTSNSGSFPSNDWRLVANDTSNGGANRFSIEDSTAGRDPFTIEAGAISNALYVDSAGDVGIGTNMPVVELHAVDGNTPTLRLDQNGSNGFTPQIWDLAGNEVNFFLRDVTNGSKLPFRVEPNTPENALYLDSTGNVGFGTNTPDFDIDIDNGTSASGNFAVRGTSGSMILQDQDAPTNEQVMQLNMSNGTLLLRGLNDALAAQTVVGMAVDMTNGNVGIGCGGNGTAINSDLVIGSDFNNCSTATAMSVSSINAGASQFTVSSSRALKENLQPVRVVNILDRIHDVGVYQYDFIHGSKDNLGLMAEDFHTVFGRGSDKLLNGQEVQMALWLAVQELTEQNKELTKKVEALLKAQKAQAE